MTTLFPGSVKGTPSGRAPFLETWDVSHRFQSVRFTEWTLGFKQFSLHHAVRVSTGLPIDGFSASRLSETC